MAEPVGLALGVLGIAGLFASCIENFDIVVRARDFGEEFDLLCTQLSLQRIRLVLWGESLGLVPGPKGKRIPYNKAVDRPDIRPAIASSLNHLQLLLGKADVVTDRYELKDGGKAVQVMPAKGLMIFRERFEAFRGRIRKNQKDKSAWAVTRWSIHDSAKFEALINKIRDLMDGLEGITSSLGLLEQQRALLKEEIESISDTKSLRLLQEVASSQRTSVSQRLVSDTASHRLSLVTRPASSRAVPSVSKFTGSSRSFYTAESVQHEISNIIGEDDIEEDHLGESAESPLYSMSVVSDTIESVSLESLPTDNTRQTKIEMTNNVAEKGAAEVPALLDIPQNQRVVSDLLKRKGANLPELSFTSGESNYGDAIAKVKAEDEEMWKDKSLRLSLNADKGQSVARRMFLELRTLRHVNVPFVSAAPVEDSLDKILASIEGPPDTPYEGGIFWITVKIPAGNPSLAPSLRFQTKIFHPNIDSSGLICADYQSWWNDNELNRHLFNTKALAGGSNDWWFSERASSRYSLGALLTALCALLASPNVEDPLVPEIAELYITDHQRFREVAREYTQMYARGERPHPESLCYQDESQEHSDLRISVQRNLQQTASVITAADTLSVSSQLNKGLVTIHNRNIEDFGRSIGRDSVQLSPSIITPIFNVDQAWQEIDKKNLCWHTTALYSWRPFGFDKPASRSLRAELTMEVADVTGLKHFKDPVLLITIQETHQWILTSHNVTNFDLLKFLPIASKDVFNNPITTPQIKAKEWRYCQESRETFRVKKWDGIVSFNLFIFEGLPVQVVQRSLELKDLNPGVSVRIALKPESFRNDLNCECDGLSFFINIEWSNA